MRIYLNCVEAIQDIGRELKKCSTQIHTQTMQNKDISRDINYNTREIQSFDFAIVNTGDKDAMPGVTVQWVNDEFVERISSKYVNPGKAWKQRKEVWEEFLVNKVTHEEENGEPIDSRVFEYSYNERIVPQLQPVIDELKKNPETRQAIIEIHNNAKDLKSMGTKRVPCSMFYHFMIRDRKLDVIYVMRSSDFATHFQNDIWLADELRRYIAAMVGVEVGKFFMHVSSLHIYQRDWNLLKNY